MFVFLSKLLPLFVYPVGLACILIIVGLMISKWRRWQRIVLILALLMLWLGGNHWVSMALARSLEWRYLPPAEIPKADVIVVLSGGTLGPDYPRPIVETDGAGDRIIYAAHLFKRGIAPHILLTGGTIDWMNQTSSPTEEMATILEMMGVPREAMWFEPDSQNTAENAAYSSKILKEKGIQRILLVTSASHMPRAVKLFQAQGLEVTPLPTDFTVTQKDWNNLTHADIKAQILGLLPSAENLSLTSRMLKEYIGMLVYSLRGWK